MPIVVRPEDVRLPKKKLRKDILYRLGLAEGKQIGLEEGLLKSAQEMVITLVEGKLGYVPEGLEERVRDIQDREFCRLYSKKLISSENLLEVLGQELKL